MYIQTMPIHPQVILCHSAKVRHQVAALYRKIFLCMMRASCRVLMTFRFQFLTATASSHPSGMSPSKKTKPFLDIWFLRRVLAADGTCRTAEHCERLVNFVETYCLLSLFQFAHKSESQP